MRTQSFDPVPKHHMEEVVTLCEEYVNGGSSNQPVKIITSSKYNTCFTKRHASLRMDLIMITLGSLFSVVGVGGITKKGVN